MIKFIAECGLNHNGNHDLMYELVRQAYLSGADIAKFQLGWREKKNEINCLTEKRIKDIVNYCKYLGIEPMFSVLNLRSYELVKKLNLDKIKIASRTLKDDFNLAKKIVNEKNNLIISLGMWNSKHLPFKKTDKIKYLWCKSKYPCLLSDLKNFPKKFNGQKIDGYSDHTIGIETCLIAISRGASIIEKHFTLDKSDTTIRDHVLSATPNEFKYLVDRGREIFRQIRSGI
jgi:N,N'-diacetyllegionaminate synthase